MYQTVHFQKSDLLESSIRLLDSYSVGEATFTIDICWRKRCSLACGCPFGEFIFRNITFPTLWIEALRLPLRGINFQKSDCFKSYVSKWPCPPTPPHPQRFPTRKHMCDFVDRKASAGCHLTVAPCKSQEMTTMSLNTCLEIVTNPHGSVLQATNCHIM